MIGLAATSSTPLPQASEEPAPVALSVVRRRRPLRPAAKVAIGFGALSAVLYSLLYLFGDDIRHWAELTSQGDKAYFLAPIGIAFVFSLVHGLFTDRFWEALGLTAKR